MSDLVRRVLAYFVVSLLHERAASCVCQERKPMSGVSIDPLSYYPDVAEAVGKLSEHGLRAVVPPPLLRALSYVDIRMLHGPREEGKDLLAWRMSEIETTEWVGFVVKAGDITAQVAS